MRNTEALSRLLALGRPVIRTGDAAAVLGKSVSSTSHQLRALADAKLIQRLSNGLWNLAPSVDPLVVASWVTDPLPSYVSLYSALRLHGMIQQIPRSTYVVSTSKTRQLNTIAGRFSIHQIDPVLFGGFVEDRGRRIATPDKAVFDTLYLERARSGRFRGLTELEIPVGFSVAALNAWVDRIPDPKLRRHVATTVAGWIQTSAPDHSVATTHRRRRTRAEGQVS